MYFPYFVAYMVVGFGVSLAVFFWALNRGQFRDQRRARFLPLESAPSAVSVKLTRKGRVESWGLFDLACWFSGAGAIEATLERSLPVRLQWTVIVIVVVGTLVVRLSTIGSPPLASRTRQPPCSRHRTPASSATTGW